MYDDTPSIDEDYPSSHLYETNPLQPITLAAIREEAGRLKEYLKSALRVGRPSPELGRLKDLLTRGKSIDSTPLGQQARLSLRCDDKSLAELTEHVQRLLYRVWLLTLGRNLPSSRTNPSRIFLAKSRFASGSQRADWSLRADGYVYDEAGNLVFDTRLHTADGPFGERRLLHELLLRLSHIRREVLGVEFARDAREIKHASLTFASVLQDRLTGHD